LELGTLEILGHIHQFKCHILEEELGFVISDEVDDSLAMRDIIHEDVSFFLILSDIMGDLMSPREKYSELSELIEHIGWGSSREHSTDDERGTHESRELTIIDRDILRLSHTRMISERVATHTTDDSLIRDSMHDLIDD
jgi:hypothetical protein